MACLNRHATSCYDKFYYQVYSFVCKFICCNRGERARQKNKKGEEEELKTNYITVKTIINYQKK